MFGTDLALTPKIFKILTFFQSFNNILCCACVFYYLFEIPTIYQQLTHNGVTDSVSQGGIQFIQCEINMGYLAIKDRDWFVGNLDISSFE